MIDKEPQSKDKKLPEPDQSRERAKEQAHVASHFIIPVALSNIIGKDTVNPLGAKFCMDATLFEAGKPTDPVERMLLQQMTIAHYRLAQLQESAATAKALKEANIFNDAATRLPGEFRRLALAIRDYRQPPSQKSFSVVHQQNVVKEGQQTVQYVDNGNGKATLAARDEPQDATMDAVENRLRGAGDIQAEPQEQGCPSTQRQDAMAPAT